MPRPNDPKKNHKGQHTNPAPRPKPAPEKPKEPEEQDTPLLKRLIFGEEKLIQVRAGLKSLMALPDPIGATLMATDPHGPRRPLRVPAHLRGREGRLVCDGGFRPGVLHPG